MNGTTGYRRTSPQKALERYIATWDYASQRADELSITKGDILLVAEDYDDGWMRGLRLKDMAIGFFPANFVAEDTSPIYKLQSIRTRGMEDYKNDPRFSEVDSSRRSKIALEIFTSEDVYVKKMRMLNEKFVEPLKHQNVISHEDYGPVFSHIQPLLSLSENLAVQLQSRMEGWDERQTHIGDVFVHTGAHFKLFVNYAVHHTLGRQVLQKISKQEKFQKWLEKTETECQRTLDSLLLEPIQRVPRYEMLLKDLLKHTSEDHPDYPALRDGLVLVQKIATECNEHIRKAENELRLFAISRRFPSDDVNIVQAKRYFRKPRTTKGLGRKKSVIDNTQNRTNLSFRSFFDSEHQRLFIREGSIHKTNSDFTDSSDRYLLLCSDILLIAQVTNKAKKIFKLKERLPLVHAWLTDSFMSSTKIPDRGFILGTPNKMYHFLANSVEEKRRWYSELHKLILVQKHLFGKLLSHLSVPDESFCCVKVRAKVNYLGMLKDELSFQAGDELMVLGFKDTNGNSKWRPGLYSSAEPFDPSPDWCIGIIKDSFGWFPAQCVASNDNRLFEPSADDFVSAPMRIVLKLKERMMDLTGRDVPPLTDSERVVRVYTGDGIFKTLRIPMNCTIEDVVKMYFKVESEHHLAWSLIEMSLDETVERVLEPFEDPSRVVDFWGKNKDQMKFFLRQNVINAIGASEY